MIKRLKLSSEIDPGVEFQGYNITALNKDLNKSQTEKLMSKSVINSDYVKKQEIPPYEVSERQIKKHRRTEREKTKGTGWFNMSAGEMTEEAKNDLTAIKLRGGLYKDHFFKKNDSDVLPKYFEMGTIVDNAVDFYSDRVPKKQRKQTILEELMEDAKVKKFTKKHYSMIQTKEEKRRKQLLRSMKRRKKQKK